LAVSNFFGFSVVPVALLFFLFPALSLSPAKKDQPHYSPVNNLQAVSIAGIALLGLYGLMFVAKMWRADYLFNMGRNQVKAGQLQIGYQNLDKAVILSPGEPVFRNDLSEAAAQLAVAYSSPSAQMSQQFTQQAVKESDETIRQNPVSLNFWRSRIKVFLLLAMVDGKYYNQALEAFDRAIALSPTDAKLYYNLALVYNQLGQTGLAEQLLVKTIDLRPNYEAARQNLGALYEQTNRPDLAREQYEYILQYLNPENATAKEKTRRLLHP
jgi:tetratricopeptide (TPR) repeat protein